MKKTPRSGGCRLTAYAGGKGKDVGPERLNDQEVARLVKKTALAAGMRGDLSEAERGQKFAGTRFAPASPPRPKPTSAMCKNSPAMPQPK